MSKELNDLIEILKRVNENGFLDRFSYTEDAYENEIVEGVESYDFNNSQNIPSGSGLDEAVKDKGFRTQSSSLSRELMNHFFGRTSYNLNLLVKKLHSFFEMYSRDLAKNINEYDPDMTYNTGDICFYNSNYGILNKQFINCFICVSDGVKGVEPTNTVFWKPLDIKTNFETNVYLAQNINDYIDTGVYYLIYNNTQNVPLQDPRYILKVDCLYPHIRQQLHCVFSGKSYTRYIILNNGNIIIDNGWFPTEDPDGLAVHALDHLYVFTIDTNGDLLLNYHGNTYDEDNNPFTINNDGELIWSV